MNARLRTDLDFAGTTSVLPTHGQEAHGEKLLVLTDTNSALPYSHAAPKAA